MYRTSPKEFDKESWYKIMLKRLKEINYTKVFNILSMFFGTLFILYACIIYYNTKLIDAFFYIFGSPLHFIMGGGISLFLTFMSHSEPNTFISKKHHSLTRLLTGIYLNCLLLANIGIRFELFFLAFANLIWLNIELWLKKKITEKT